MHREPTPGKGEVLIAVKAAAVNPVDWKIRQGIVAVPLPTVLGMDVSGTVAASSVADFAVDDDVFESRRAAATPSSRPRLQGRSRKSRPEPPPSRRRRSRCRD